MNRVKALAAIHVAKKARGFDDDAYRDLLERETGKRSAGDLDDLELGRVLAVIQDGRPSVPARRAGDPRPIAKKVTALWLMLWNLDEVTSRHDKAIAAFVKGVTGKEAVRFCTNGELGKVVEALKAWCKRVDVDADTTHAQLDPLRSLVFEQGLRLADRANPDIIAAFAPRVQRRATLNVFALQQLANELGTYMRRLKLGHRHQGL